MSNNLYKLDIKKVIENLKVKEFSSEELVKSVCDRIKKVDEKICSFLSTDFEKSIQEARNIDQRRSKGEDVGLLAGIPVAVKDSIMTKGFKTTCGSKILKDFMPAEDATVVERLKKSGAIIIGKTNLDEFAMGSSTENSAFCVTKNPFDLERVAGGSSGGSVAAVSADECIFSIGSDTGGSIRQPASFCGNVGLKPTYGRVSRYGLVAMASSLDQIGPITKTVYDSALVMEVISGYDAKDATTVNGKDSSYLSILGKDIQGLRIGVIKELMTEGINNEIKNKVEEAIKKLQDLGAIIEEVSLPSLDYSLAVYYIIMPAEVSSNLARYDGIKYGYSAIKNDQEKINNLLDVYLKTRSAGFGEEVKRRIMLGAYVLSYGYYDAYYLKAQKVRNLIKNDFEKSFKKFDVLLSPTTPTLSFKIGEKTNNPLEMYLTDICTVSANLAGVPAISIPVGLTKDNLPIGLQFIAPHFREDQLFKVSYAYEQSSERIAHPNL